MAALECFDGLQTTLDLRSELVRITGEIQVGELEKHIFSMLDEAAFLENETYRERKEVRELEFQQQPTREAAFAGAAYPEGEPELRDLLGRKIGSAGGESDTVAIAAPHASPDAGWSTYRAAFSAMPAKIAAVDRTFVVLGTSHYGAPNRFGLTRKPFVTPFGKTKTANGFVDELQKAAPSAIRMEDYCHAVEHSIEFQVLFLQHLYGPDIQILPILCGPFVQSIYEGGLPEEDESVARFLDALCDLHQREGKRLFWVLGVDMAHMGLRYGDQLRASADLGEMLAVRDRDQGRIAAIAAGNRRHYWDQVQEGQDDLKWCGASPFYTFMKAVPGLKGELRHYHQWQIDSGSVVSFGALRFWNS